MYLKEDIMARTSKLALSLSVALAVIGTAAAQEHGREQPRPEPPRGEAPHGEPHPGPKGYQRVTEPHGWNSRPTTVDRDAYRHNFQAARSFKIGPYYRPHGWAPHHWVYGQMLPRAYWAAPYLIADYWLFSLEVPPSGYEWVRDNTDALLIDTNTGEILQVEYGVFG
jgi:Ni/Co efflux regulator RcnB